MNSAEAGIADVVRLEVAANGVARVTLNRPERRNAFDGRVVDGVHEAIRQLGRDPRVRVIVVTGAGATFCAGADLEHMAAMARADAAANFADALALAEMLAALDQIDKPTVARVNGDAFGGGLGLIACCDIAIGVLSARFALTEVRLGLVPATISPFVTAAIGVRAMRRYTLTGERFDGRRAFSLGLLHEVVEAAELDAAVDAVVQDILHGAPLAQGEAKQLIREVAGAPRDAPLRRSVSHRLARLRDSTEARERVQSFLDRRPP